jgi:hypothetical protein
LGNLCGKGTRVRKGIVEKLGRDPNGIEKKKKTGMMVRQDHKVSY